MSTQPCCHKNSRKARNFEKREQEILATALDQFCSDEWECVTVAEIARQVGIAKGTMYLHFSSKHEIYVKLVLDFYRALLMHLGKPLTGTPPQQLRQLIKRAFEFHLERPAYRRVTLYCEREDVRHTVNPEITRELDKINHDIENIIHRILLSGIEQQHFKAKPPQQLILCLQCTFQGALTRFWCNRHSEQSATDQFVNTIINYILDTITSNESDKITPARSALKQQPTIKKYPQTGTENKLEMTS